MTPFLAALALLLGGGLLSLLPALRSRQAATLGAGAVVAGAGLGLIPVMEVLLGGEKLEFSLPWSIPGGSFILRIDGLSAFFLAAVLFLSAVCAVYGRGYLGARHRSSWFFLNALVASMAVVVAAGNAMLFLFAWEGMALASFFLVTLDHGEARVRRAGLVYLVSTHIGTAFVLVLFAIWGTAAHSFDFAGWGQAGVPAGTALCLAIVGFGTKAGIVPLHVWLPEAHPAAPSHVSAVMSGVMVKTGIYALLRVLSWLGPLPVGQGLLLVAIGAFSGLAGVLLALAQPDLKRLLAYSTVENIGIIVLGLGLGEIGRSTGSPALAVLGFGGALLHVWNHALFKGLLFLGAGTVLHATGTTATDELGGLGRRLRWTSSCFLVGAAAISALPPLNGFASEFLLCVGAVRGFGPNAAASIGIPGAIVGLGLIGGLAAACFTKAFGITFLGEPRTARAAVPQEADRLLRWPPALLAALCIGIGLGSPWILPVLSSPIGEILDAPTGVIQAILAETGQILRLVTFTSIAFLGIVVALVLIRRRLLAGRSRGSGPTWDCGYAEPTARMQYTGHSFTQPITDLCALPYSRTASNRPATPFMKPARVEPRTGDPFTVFLFTPVFLAAGWLSDRLRWLQRGRTHLYILYIVAALVALLLLEVS